MLVVAGDPLKGIPSESQRWLDEGGRRPSQRMFDCGIRVHVAFHVLIARFALIF